MSSHHRSTTKPNPQLWVVLSVAAAGVAGACYYLWRSSRCRHCHCSSGQSLNRDKEEHDIKYGGLTDPNTPTAQSTAFKRFLIPPWRTPGATTHGSYGEPFGEDAFAQYFLTEAQKEMAKMCQGAEEFRKKAVEKLQKASPDVSNWLWTRTRCIDQQVYQALAGSEQDPLQQLVFLGAGYDTRSYRFARMLKEKGIKSFEVDLPHLQTKKVQAMREIARKEKRDIGLEAVTFVPLDLSRPREELLSEMRKSGYNTGLSSLFVWEGVTAYLTKDAVRSSLEFMRDGSAKHSRVLVTFVSPAIDDTADGERMRRAVKAKGEPHKFYPTVDEMSALLNVTGWRVEQVYTPERLANEFMTPDEGQAWRAGNIILARKQE